jgi:hypothetical protein
MSALSPFGQNRMANKPFAGSRRNDAVALKATISTIAIEPAALILCRHLHGVLHRLTY